MKKSIITIATLLASVSASVSALADTSLPSIDYMYDAMRLGQNIYYGSARSMALGGAATALGGDIGMMDINPAGSAVAGFSQFSITPGLNISNTASSYSADQGTTYGSPSSMTKTAFTMPSVGMCIVLDGDRRVTFGVLANQTNNYNNFSSVYGTNANSSYFAKLACAATELGYLDEKMVDQVSFSSTSIPWDLLAARQSGSIGSIYGADGTYMANTQSLGSGKIPWQSGNINQNCTNRSWGAKTDLIINFGYQPLDWLYIGANLGIPYSNYNYQRTVTETPVSQDALKFIQTFTDGSGNPVSTQFLSSELSYQFASRTDGVYLKIGMIAVPVNNLRLGFAFRTPTVYKVSEYCSYSGSSYFSDSRFSTTVSFPSSDRYVYRVRSSYEMNLGLACTFGKLGLISADYELTDYSVTRLSEISDNFYYSGSFSRLNDLMKNFCGVSHSLRLGGELNLGPYVSARAGYSILTSPERYYVSGGQRYYAADCYESMSSFVMGERHYVKDFTQSYSLGLGFNSAGAFFADIAVRLIRYPSDVTRLYGDYEAYTKSGAESNPPVYYVAAGPYRKTVREQWNAALTIGWRF